MEIDYHRNAVPLNSILRLPDPNLFFRGYAILNNDHQNAEWGYISFNELKALKLKWLEVDCETEEAWKIRKASEIDKIKA